MKITFEECFFAYLENAEENGEIKATTARNYAYEYKRILLGKEITGRPVEEIRKQEVIKLLRELVLPRGSIMKKRFAMAKSLIHHIFAYASIELLLDCISVKPILQEVKFSDIYFREEAKKQKKQVFTIDEIKKVKEGLEGSQNIKELGILLALTTGMRIGEICVLEKSAIKKGYIEVKTAQEFEKIEGRYCRVVGKPKKNKQRKVVLSAEAKEVVERIKKKGNKKSKWLFPQPGNSDKFIPSNSFDDTIRRFCRRINVPVRSFHKLRKTYASVLLSRGVPSEVVAQQLGHSRIATTLDYYYYNPYDTKQSEKLLREACI